MTRRELNILDQRFARWWGNQRVLPTALGVALGILIVGTFV